MILTISKSSFFEVFEAFLRFYTFISIVSTVRDAVVMWHEQMKLLKGFSNNFNFFCKSLQHFRNQIAIYSI